MNTQLAFDDGLPGDVVPGLLYRPRYLDQRRGAQVLETVDAQPWMTSLSRRVQHYGWRYDYRARSVSDSSRLGPLPGWLADLAQQLHADGFSPTVPDQVIVNEYVPGQGIAPHVDCQPCFGPVVAMLSLGSPVQMDYEKVDGPGRTALLLEPESLVILTGDARYQWRHGIAKRRFDSQYGVRRSRRVSLTFRTVQPMGERHPPTGSWVDRQQHGPGCHGDRSSTPATPPATPVGHRTRHRRDDGR
jgi:alkylated DNA repair dioxygenase AlkB